VCRAEGSGAPRPSCLERAERKGAIARALRRALPGGLVLEDCKLVESVSP
jgi:hypothetical protein